MFLLCVVMALGETIYIFCYVYSRQKSKLNEFIFMVFNLKISTTFQWLLVFKHSFPYLFFQNEVYIICSLLLNLWPHFSVFIAKVVELKNINKFKCLGIILLFGKTTSSWIRKARHALWNIMASLHAVFIIDTRWRSTIQLSWIHSSRIMRCEYSVNEKLNSLSQLTWPSAQIWKFTGSEK